MSEHEQQATTAWEAVADPSELLALLGEVGDGMRVHGLHTVSVATDPVTGAVRCEFAHARQGRFAVTVAAPAPEPARQVGADGDEVTPEDFGRWAGSSCWRLGDPRYPRPGRGSAVTLTRRTIFGRQALSFRTSQISVERAAFTARPGCCRVCGSDRITVKLQAELPLTATDEGAFSWDGELAFRNVLGSAACAGCGTAHPAVGFGGRLRASINGVEFTPENSGSAQPIPAGERRTE